MNSKAALLWDEAYIWAVMAWRRLRELGLGADPLTFADVRAGKLSDYAALVVPGGWASNKIKALGADGVEAIRGYVRSGGRYLGICGGAGFATEDGIGLIPVKRKPTSERVPSLAGRVHMKLADHPVWEGVPAPVSQLWWPSQFVAEDTSLKVLARFDHMDAGAFSSDFAVADVAHGQWAALEAEYGINLDPARMSGEPLIVEGACGSGAVIASLAHLDAPGCAFGARALENIWRRWELERTGPGEDMRRAPRGRIYDAALALHEFGLRNFLWIERGPLVQWRRGIRGLEYHNLFHMARELASYDADVKFPAECERLTAMVEEFAAKARELLTMERAALRQGKPMTYAESGERGIAAVREELFSKSKSYGGFYKEILDLADSVLVGLIKDAHAKRGGRGQRLVHVYTGPGKGKTTAAVGLAVRAKSRGMRVVFAQFMKGRGGGELDLLESLGVEVIRFTDVKSPLFDPHVKTEANREAARAALVTLKALMPLYDLMVLDEFAGVMGKEILTEDEGLAFLASRPIGLEIAVTGRGAGEALLKMADLVTVMSDEKHPYRNGVQARPGIEY